MLYARTMMPGKVSAMGKVYEEVAALAYQRVSKEAFQWLPQWVLSLMGIDEPQAEQSTCVEPCPQEAAQEQSSLYQVIRSIGNGRSVTALLAPRPVRRAEQRGAPERSDQRLPHDGFPGRV